MGTEIHLKAAFEIVVWDCVFPNDYNMNLHLTLKGTTRW